MSWQTLGVCRRNQTSSPKKRITGDFARAALPPALHTARRGRLIYNDDAGNHPEQMDEWICRPRKGDRILDPVRAAKSITEYGEDLLHWSLEILCLFPCVQKDISQFCDISIFLGLAMIAIWQQILKNCFKLFIQYIVVSWNRKYDQNATDEAMG